MPATPIAAAVWKHLPITSPWAAPGKPSSSFTHVLLNQGWFDVNCRSHNAKVGLDGCPAADYHSSKQYPFWLTYHLHVGCFGFSDPTPTVFQFHGQDSASLCLARLTHPQCPWFWLCYQHPTSQSIPCSLLTTLAGGNDVDQIERK